MAEIKTVLTEEQILEMGGNWFSRFSNAQCEIGFARAIEAAVLSANAGKVDAVAMQAVDAQKVQFAFENIRNNYEGWQDNDNFAVLARAIASLRYPPTGMPTSQEPKYGIRENRLYNRATGEFIPLDEPVFIFRARDMKGKKHIAAYADDCQSADIEHYRAVAQRVADFSLFELKHPDRMKYPDTAPSPTQQAIDAGNV